MNPLTFAILWALGKEPQGKDRLYTSLEPSTNKENKAMKAEIASLQGQLGKENLAKKRKAEEDKQVDTEKEVVHSLNEQRKKFEEDKFGEIVDLGDFFYKLKRDKKFKIEITDKDDHQVFGEFGGIGISSKTGDLVIFDKNYNPLSYGDSIGHIIFKPETVGNQIKRQRILLPRDKDFNPAIDIESIEVPDVVYNVEEDTYYNTTEFRDTIKNLWVKKDKELRDKNNYIERLELQRITITKDLRDNQRALALYKNLAKVAESELSQAMGKDLQVVAHIGGIQRKIASLTEMKAYYEDRIKADGEIIQKLLAKLERNGDKDSFELTKAEVYTDLQNAKQLLPETIIQQMDEEKKDTKMPSPGDSIAKGGSKI